MRTPRFANVVLAAAAAFAGGAVNSLSAGAHPVMVRPPPDPIAQLAAQNAELRRDNEILQGALDNIDRVNHRSRDRYTRRAIDRTIDDARARIEQAVVDGDYDHGYDRDHRDGGYAQPAPLAKADFDQLQAHVAAASFEQDRLQLVATAASRALFTVDQVVALMQTSTFDDSRIEIAATLRPRVVDPARWYLVYDALQFSQSRDTLRQRVGQ